MDKEMEIQQKRENMLHQIKKFRLLDDDFMTKCFENNKEATELVLRIILNNPDISVKSVQTQYNMKNIKGRSLRLDIYATDTEGKKYNIEIQRADTGAGAKRARYNSSLIDSDILPSGFEVDNLPEVYVIFITEHDVFGKNKLIYHVDRIIGETKELFCDGSHIIYVNATYKDDSELGKLMHDFTCSNPDDMNYQVLARTTRYYKEDKEGISTMCKAVEDMINEEKKSIALRFLEKGIVSIEDIAECSELPIDVVKKLALSIKKPE